MKKLLRVVYKIFLRIRLGNKYSGILANSFVSDYINNYSLNKIFKIYLIHRKGFCYEDWKSLHLNNKIYKNYLSNVDYCAMHPINGFYSKWIDDKLTLKYLCSGTILDKYMPKYYFQIDSNGKILKLMDYNLEKEKYTVDDILALLIDEKSLAIKLFNGSLGKGFYKAEYKNKKFYLNEEEFSKLEFSKKISSLKNYLIIEYLKTNDYFSKYSKKSVNSLRVLVGRVDERLEIFNCHLRLGTNQSGFVENYNHGGVLCIVDKNGYFDSENIIENGVNKEIKLHPDNNIELKGQIPIWNKLLKAIDDFDKYFPQLVYLGFDMVINNKDEIKILEINSLNSLDGLQVKGSVFESIYSKFFEERMNKRK